MQELSTQRVRPYVPTPTSIDRPFWAGGADSVLRLPFCEGCARWFFPPAATCPDCNEPAGFRDTSGTGVVYTFTVNVGASPRDVDTNSYAAEASIVDRCSNSIGQI